MLGGLPTPGFAASPRCVPLARACRDRGVRMRARRAYRVTVSVVARARARAPAREVIYTSARALALAPSRVREPGAGKAADPPVMLSSS